MDVLCSSQDRKDRFKITPGYHTHWLLSSFKERLKYRGEFYHGNAMFCVGLLCLYTH